MKAVVAKMGEYRGPLEVFNTLTWFLMDAAWMLEGIHWALLLAPFVVVSGVLLCFSDSNRSMVFVNLSVLSWILMNLTWMISEQGNTELWMKWSRTGFGVGCICLGFALATSKSPMQTLAAFRRLRFRQTPTVADRG